MGLLDKLRGKKEAAPRSAPAASAAADWYMTIEVSDVELNRWTPAATWGATAFLREEIDNAQSNDKSRMLVVFTGNGCDGCETLMEQLGDERYLVEPKVHLVRALVGDFPARWYQHILMGDTILHLPGLPTAFLAELPATGSEEMTLIALSLGPLDSARVTEDLTENLLAGTSRWIGDAGNAVIEIDQAGTRQKFTAANKFALRMKVTLTSEDSPVKISPVMQR